MLSLRINVVMQIGGITAVEKKVVIADALNNIIESSALIIQLCNCQLSWIQLFIHRIKHATHVIPYTVMFIAQRWKVKRLSISFFIHFTLNQMMHTFFYFHWHICPFSLFYISFERMHYVCCLPSTNGNNQLPYIDDPSK